MPVDLPVGVQWISHRGLSDEEAEGTVENTLTSFQLAVDDGFDWLETDIRISTDGELFLHHDQSLLRTTGEDINPESLSADELREITLLDGQRLCFFDEFVEQFDGSNWVLDIKAEQGDRALEVLEEINKVFAKVRFEEARKNSSMPPVIPLEESRKTAPATP